MLRRFLFVCILAALGWAQSDQPAGGQSAPAPVAGGEQASPIRVQVDEVIVPVSVTDQDGAFVTGLTKEDFAVFDQGVRQEIEYFNAEHNQPVVIGFLIDQSNTMRLRWNRYQDAVIELVLALMPEDDRFSGYLISYSNDAELLVNTTSDATALVEKIRDMKPAGGAALFDAIYLACTRRELVKGEPIEPRRVIILVGDGHDNASSKTFDEVLELAQRNLVTIYAVSTVSFDFDSPEEATLVKLARQTGGRVEYPLDGVYKDVAGFLSKPSDAGNYALTVGTGGYAAHIAQNIFDAIAAMTGDISTQYILRYRPTVTDDPRIFRQLRVDVNLPGVKVRHRSGYYPYTP